nr:hypothetical protein [Allomuricauda sp.]
MTYLNDGNYMTIQYSVIGETTGIGHGIVIWDFEKEKELLLKKSARKKKER